MDIQRFIALRGLVPTKLREIIINSTIYSLYALVDERQLNKQPEHLRSVLTRSFTYYCIFESNVKTKDITDMHNYLKEGEALELFLELTKDANPMYNK